MIVEEENIRIDTYLSSKLDISRSKIQKLIDEEIFEPGSSGKLTVEDLKIDVEKTYEEKWNKRFKEEILDRC